MMCQVRANVKAIKSRRFPTEWIDRQLAADGIGYMRLVLSLDDRIDVRRLRSALQQVLDAVPVLSSRFDEHFWSPRWVTGEHDINDILRVGPAPGSSATLDVDATSLSAAMYVLVNQGSSEAVADEIVILFDHKLGDFRAMYKCVQLLTDIYTRLERDPDYVMPPLAPFDRGFSCLARRLTKAERRSILTSGFQMLRDLRRCGKWRLRRADPSKPGEESYSVHHECGCEAAARLEAYALERGVTAFQALLAAYFVALTEVLSGSDPLLIIHAPVDLRPRFGPGTPFSIANLLGVVPVMLHRDQGKTLDVAIEAVRQQMLAARKRSLGAAGSPLLFECLPSTARWICRLVPHGFVKWRNRRRRAAVNRRLELSSVVATFGGPIDSDRIRFGSIATRNVTAELRPADSSGGRLLQILAFDDRLTISIGWGRLDEMALIRTTLLRVLAPALDAPAACFESVHRAAGG
jgi:NRPS condensation-like uncharacterized protein